MRFGGVKIGRVTDDGIIVTLKEFKAHFSYIKTQYIDSYLPSVTFEAGQHTLTHTRFMFRVRKGVYRVHPELLLVRDKDKR